MSRGSAAGYTARVVTIGAREDAITKTSSFDCRGGEEGEREKEGAKGNSDDGWAVWGVGGEHLGDPEGSVTGFGFAVSSIS